MDRKSGTISLRRLVDEVKQNAVLFTRENFVAFDGLPYNYEPVQTRVMMAQVNKGPFWQANTGPEAWVPSLTAHELFDRLAGINKVARQRGDRIPQRVFDRLSEWLSGSGAKPLVDWSHNFLAHAGSQARRQTIDLDAALPTLEKITNVLASLVRVADALARYVIHDSGIGTVVPVPQFNKFEHIGAPLASTVSRNQLQATWDGLEAERNKFLDVTLESLLH